MLKRSQKATKTSETMWNKGSSCFACRGSQFVQPCGCRESFRKASRRETWLHCTVFVCLFWVSSLWFFGTVSLLDSQSVLFLSATERWIHRDTMVDLLACHIMFYNKSIYIYKYARESHVSAISVSSAMKAILIGENIAITQSQPYKVMWRCQR